MKVKNPKTAELYRYGLYVEQLKSYAELSQIMQEFNKIYAFEKAEQQRKERAFSEKSDSDYSVDEFLKKYLQRVSMGDTTFFNSEEFKMDLGMIPPAITDQTIKNLRQYAYSSQNFLHLKEADKLFKNCIKTDENHNVTEFHQNRFEHFQKSMRKSSKLFSRFDKAIENNSYTNIASYYGKMAKASAYTIDQIYGTEYLSKLEQHEKFNPAIKGFFNPERFSEAIQTLSEEEKTTSQKFYEKLGKFYTGHKKDFQRAAAAALAIYAIYSGVSIAHEVKEYNNINIENAEENGFDLQIRKSTSEKLKQDRESLENLRNSDEFPTQDQIQDFRTQLDDDISLVISDLATSAIKRDYPNLTVISVENSYNIRQANSGDNRDSVIINYLDENGEQQVVTITNFFNDNFFTELSGNTIQGTFSDEINLGTFTNSDSIFEELYKKAFDADLPFDERGKHMDNIINLFDEILTRTENVAAKNPDLFINPKGIFSQGSFRSKYGAQKSRT